MKKFLAAIVCGVVLMFSQVEAAEISREDSCFAFETITKTLCEWKCTPLKIWYGGDELNSAENVAYMNELAESRGFEPKFSACMVFYSDFRSPPDDGTISAWNYDSKYENYSWYFGLYSDGTWKLMTSGY